DSLEEIANKYGVSERDIARANPDDVETRNEHHTEKVKVYGRRGHVKWEKRSFTVARYEVSAGHRLTIPRDRSGRADSSSDDAAAHAAKSRFGLDVARLEDQNEPKGKNKKDKKKDSKKPEKTQESDIAQRAPLPQAEPVAPKPAPRYDDLAV